ncbi:MAG: DUF222 domain-containing protein, partial [Deltaproteobacteria bacterium]
MARSPFPDVQGCLHETVDPRLRTPRELHKALLKANELSNRARWKFLVHLRALDEIRGWLALGFSSLTQYLTHTYKLSSAEAHEYARVAYKLDLLPKTRQAFREGKLSWSAVKCITRVARKKTEEAWIAFAERESVRRLEAEVRAAREDGRDHPREGSEGLPAPSWRITLDFRADEEELARKGLLKAARELRGDGGGRPVTLKEAFLFLCKLALETDPSGIPKGRVKNEEPLVTLVYHRCPECKKGRMATADGPVPVPAEVLDRIEPTAKVESIDEEDSAPATAPGKPPEENGGETEAAAKAKAAPDRKTPASLRRKVLLRDGMTCRNPGCGRRLGLQAHHLVFRSQGGKTELSNEVAVCARCHAAIHFGLLKV